MIQPKHSGAPAPDLSDPAQWPYDPAEHPSPPQSGARDFLVAGLIVLAVIAGGFVYAGHVATRIDIAATDGIATGSTSPQAPAATALVADPLAAEPLGVRPAGPER